MANTTSKRVALQELKLQFSTLASFSENIRTTSTSNISESEENIIANIYSKIYKIKFYRLQERELNYPGIDVGSEDYSLGIQVSGTSTVEKVKDSLRTFYNKKKDLEFKRFQIVFISFKRKPALNPRVINSFLNKYLKLEDYNRFKDSNIDLNKIAFNLQDLQNEISKLSVKIINKIINIIKSEIGTITFYSSRSIFKQFAILDDKSLEDLKSQNTFEAIANFIKLSGFINIIPTHFFYRYPPFTINFNNPTRFDQFTLICTNEYFYAAFNNISRIEPNYISTKDNKRINNLNEIRIITNVFYFLISNRIYSIQKGVMQGSRINLKWIYRDLLPINLISLQEAFLFQLDIQNLKFDNDGPYSKLLKPYYFASIGEFSKAIIELNSIYENSIDNNQYLIAFISSYNIEKISYLLWHNHLESENNVNQQIINECNPFKIITILRNNGLTNSLQSEGIDWIYNAEFITSPTRELDDLYFKLQKLRHEDRLGGWTMNNYLNKIEDIVSNVETFIKGNYLIFLDFKNLSDFIIKALESSFILYGLKNPSSTKIKYFPSYIIDKVLKHTDPNDSEKYFKMYNISDLELDNHNLIQQFTIIDIFENLLNNQEAHLSYLLANNHNVFFKHKITKYVSNICLLLKYIKIDNERFNVIVDKVTKYILRADYLQGQHLKYYFSLIEKHYKIISNNLLININKSYTEGRLNSFEFSFDNLRILSKPGLYKFRYQIINKKIERYLSLTNYNNLDFEYILDLYNISNHEQRTELKIISKKYFDENFNNHYFIRAVLMNIVNYYDYEQTYLDNIKKSVSNKQIIMGSANAFNREVNEFVILAYKLKLNLLNDKYLALKPKGKYYDWLFNMKDFNYTEFNPYWLLEYNSPLIHQRAARYKALRLSLKEYLLLNDVAGLSYIYVRYFNKD